MHPEQAYLQSVEAFRRSCPVDWTETAKSSEVPGTQLVWRVNTFSSPDQAKPFGQITFQAMVENGAPSVPSEPAIRAHMGRVGQFYRIGMKDWARQTLHRFDPESNFAPGEPVYNADREAVGFAYRVLMGSAEIEVCLFEPRPVPLAAHVISTKIDYKPLLSKALEFSPSMKFYWGEQGR